MAGPARVGLGEFVSVAHTEAGESWEGTLLWLTLRISAKIAPEAPGNDVVRALGTLDATKSSGGIQVRRKSKQCIDVTVMYLVDP